MDEHMDVFFRLHAMRWGDRPGVIRGRELQTLHRAVAHDMARRGRLRLFTMRMGDEPIASVYGFQHAGRFSYYNAGYDPDWRNASVGLVMIGQAFEAAFNEGCCEFDFLRGAAGYKFDWASKQRWLTSVRVHARRGPGTWLTRHERYRDAIRRLLRRTDGTDDE